MLMKRQLQSRIPNCKRKWMKLFENASWSLEKLVAVHWKSNNSLKRLLLCIVSLFSSLWILLIVLFLVKGNEEYHGKTFMDVPMFTGATLRPDYVPEHCFPPTKQAHTYKSHTKAINAIRWFPKSAHLFLSCAMDNKVCILFWMDIEVNLNSF
jgi:hypothetical protein